ncbi:hypothetical protein AGOR_G00172730 [Albula goreensis]|uniref:E3 ubiquitin-protein ligase n=1 Tax=Albula goreensis TaxID=1534307 RepID=A0A8T3CZJ9_9TELE|nr:hypothetical protein AGOR_G00172730 [Albula goreensis]
MAKISRAGRGVGSYSCFTQPVGSSGGKATAAEGETCPLCRGCFQKKQRLKCTHEFCAECLRRSVESLGLLCPMCHKPLSYIGDQPQGEMTWKKLVLGMIITYNIPNGIQMGAHPNPGKPFTGIRAVAFLPDTSEGKRVLQLLKRAFDQRLVFTVETRGAKDRVVYSDIPHANNWSEAFDPRLLGESEGSTQSQRH